jgi:hypothetical protein
MEAKRIRAAYQGGEARDNEDRLVPIRSATCTSGGQEKPIRRRED